MSVSILTRFIKKITPNILRPSELTKQFVMKKTRNLVLNGPFIGMKYVDDSVGSVLIPKLLGIYERELNSVLEAAIKRQPDVVVDVGAAEGYYAVGMALRLPRSSIVAFEAEEKGRKLIMSMALANATSTTISVKSWCDPTSLQEQLSVASSPFLIIDVEGYEDELISLDTVPDLKKTEILVEMHDFIVDGVTKRVFDRLSKTHHIERIDQIERQINDFPLRSLILSVLPTRYTLWAVNEFRPVKMHWLHCIPKV